MPVIVDDGKLGTIVCRTAGNTSWFKMHGKSVFKCGWYTCDVERCYWSCFARNIRIAKAAHDRVRPECAEANS